MATRHDPRQPWMIEAVCREVDPDIFYPGPGGDRSSFEEQNQAREVCSRCPVIDPCLDLALRFSGGYGIWAGMNGEERAAIKRKRARYANKSSQGGSGTDRR